MGLARLAHRDSPDGLLRWVDAVTRLDPLVESDIGHFTPSYRVKTVPKLVALKPLGLALSEKQIPQIVETTKKCGELKDPLEGVWMRPRQVRYQAALRPDI
jgi:hypothetical protein